MLLLSADFVNCGLLKLEGPGFSYCPVFYDVISQEEAERRGYRYNTVVPKSWDTFETREVTPEEIYEMGYGLERWMGENYEEIISHYIPQMDIREVPNKFLDKRAPSSLIKAARTPSVVVIQVMMREADLDTDAPELDIEEPLQDAVEEAECGSVVSSGTLPGGLFSIDIETSTTSRVKCLKVIERTLKKLGCSASTAIVVNEE